MKLDLRLFSWS